MKSKSAYFYGFLASVLALMLVPLSGNANAVRIQDRKSAADFQMAAIDGGANWKLSDYKGKVVLMNFVATWCPPCNAEMPGLVKLADA